MERYRSQGDKRGVIGVKIYEDGARELRDMGAYEDEVQRRKNSMFL